MYTAKELKRMFNDIGIKGEKSEKVPFNMGMQEQYNHVFFNKVEEFESFKLKFEDEGNNYRVDLVTADDMVFDFAVEIQNEKETRTVYYVCDKLAMHLYRSKEENFQVIESYSDVEGDFISNVVNNKYVSSWLGDCEGMIRVPENKKITKHDVSDIMNKYNRIINKGTVDPE